MEVEGNHFADSQVLSYLIRREFDWESLSNIVDQSPELVELCRISGHNTMLHEVCSVGSAPTSIVMKILKSWEGATMVKNKFGDTPLHSVARVAQRSSSKVHALLETNEQALFVKNNTGHFPLSTAIISGAFLSAIELFVETDPSILLQKDGNGQTPSELLVSSFMKNIPGFFALTSFLNGGEMRNIVRTFWNKMEYLLLRSYEQIHDLDFNSCDGSMICHALLAQNIKGDNLAHLLSLALSQNTAHCARTLDKDGNSPLHVLAKRLEFKGANVLLAKFPYTSTLKDARSRIPLHIALESVRAKTRPSKKLSSQLQNFLVSSEVLDIEEKKDDREHMLPFMIAAGDGHLDLTFVMLQKSPLSIHHYA